MKYQSINKTTCFGSAFSASPLSLVFLFFIAPCTKCGVEFLPPLCDSQTSRKKASTRRLSTIDFIGELDGWRRLFLISSSVISYSTFSEIVQSRQKRGADRNKSDIDVLLSLFDCHQAPYKFVSFHFIGISSFFFLLSMERSHRQAYT